MHIYIVYKHNVLGITRDRRMSEMDMMYVIKDVAKFGNMIATRPSARVTTEMAEHLHNEVTYVHREIISNMEKMLGNVEPCICLRHYINKKVKDIERQMDENENENEMHDLDLQYNYFLGKQLFLDQIYGEEDDEEDEEKTDSDDE